MRRPMCEMPTAWPAGPAVSLRAQLAVPRELDAHGHRGPALGVPTESAWRGAQELGCFAICFHLFVFVFNSLGEFNVHLEVMTRATKDGAHGCLACVFSQISMFIDRFMCRRVVGLCPVAVS